LQETEELVVNDPAAAERTVTELFESFDVPSSTINDLTTHLSTSPHLTAFLMRFEHSLPPPESSRAITCALTIALGYFIGGFIPLLPYFFVEGVRRGLAWSVAIMIVALFTFGYTKTCFVSGWKGWRKSLLGVRGGIEMVVVGSLAAGAAMGIVRFFNDHAGALG
jgi:VIT1/CCC1 family predicted Fe2+/Mn2+ transporter